MLTRCLAVLTSVIALLNVPDVQAQAPRDWQRAARAAVYHFGKGYAVASINSALPATVRKSVVGALEQRVASVAGSRITWIVSVEAPQKPILVNLLITRPGHLLLQDIHLGQSTVAEIVAKLGEPDKRGSDTLSYQGLAEICSDSFTFTFKSGKLSELKWDWCSD